MVVRVIKQTTEFKKKFVILDISENDLYIKNIKPPESQWENTHH